MALSEEKIAELRDVACKIAPLHRSAARPFARAIEAEVRKDDTELIRQLVEALQSMRSSGRDSYTLADEALAAGRARLEQPCA